ncbi:MAG: 50S ribosomal protein L11 [Planctomycetes bacterium]|nr:50S ribosomal protein L11 [Planctomycetota bacterium]
MAKKKEIIGEIKLQIPGGGATPAPPVGPALGAKGVNIGGFVKEFNDKSAKRRGEIIPVVISVYKDKSFTFIMKQPPVAELIKEAVGIKKGSGTAGPMTEHAKITKDQLKTIAERKMEELTAHDIEAAMKTIAGTARSMGLVVTD